MLGAERTVGVLTRHSRAMRTFDLLFAGVFGIVALRIVTMPGR